MHAIVELLKIMNFNFEKIKMFRQSENIHSEPIFTANVQFSLFSFYLFSQFMFVSDSADTATSTVFVYIFYLTDGENSVVVLSKIHDNIGFDRILKTA